MAPRRIQNFVIPANAHKRSPILFVNITIFGSGYVGLVTGACLSDVGHHVMCVDVDSRKVAALNAGKVPIHEPGFDEIIARNYAAGRIRFTADAAHAARHGDVHFIAVGTPPDEDVSADLKYVLAVATTIGQHLGRYGVVVTKSTVPVGTSDKVHAALAAALAERSDAPEFAVASNPEFLREGAVIIDFMKPTRIVVGTSDARAATLLDALYEPFTRNGAEMIRMDVRSALLTKYACNAMLATRISFMNDLANLAERLGADIEQVKHGIGTDFRIGPHFLNAGCGYGRSCFPKDVKALLRTANEAGGMSLRVVQAVEDVNEEQKHVLTRKIVAKFGENLKGKHFVVWGLAFKPDTDDMREATSVVLINDLLARGATVTAHDPVAIAEARRVFAGRNNLTFASTAAEALNGASALVVVTEWSDYASFPLPQIADALPAPRWVFDGRNRYSPAHATQAGLAYVSMGR